PCGLRPFPTRRSSDLVAGALFSPGLTEERTTMILPRTSNQKGAPRHAAQAVRNQPRSAPSHNIGFDSMFCKPWRLQPIGTLVPLDRKSTRLNSSHVSI